MRILNLICLTLLLIGCKATQPTVVEVKSEKVSRVTDTLVKVVPDSSMLKALLECDSLGRVRMRQISELQLKGIGLDVKVEGNNLTVKAKGKDTEKRRVEKSDAYVEKPVPVPYPVETNKITSWQWFQIWCGRIACLMVLVYIGWQLLGSKSKLLLNVLERAFKN